MKLMLSNFIIQNERLGANMHSENNNSKIRVVLIEDHKLMRVGLKSLFEKTSDITVVAETPSGKEGVDKIKHHKPDVVILDLKLEDISGKEVARQILASGSNSKILILSSSLSEQDTIELLKIGINGYALKDINSEMLIMVVKSINDGAMWLDSKVVELIRESSNGVIPQKTKSRQSFKATHANLTEREYEVLKLVVDGKSNHEIAEILKISEHTSKAHVCNVIQKLVVDDRTQAAVKAIKEGIV